MSILAYEILKQLSEERGGVQWRDIELNQPSYLKSKLIDDAIGWHERAGSVILVHSADDRRNRVYQITDKGVEALRREEIKLKWTGRFVKVFAIAGIVSGFIVECGKL